MITQSKIDNSIYDVKNNGIYRVEGNPRRKSFKKDERFKFKV